ncbi:MAG: DUF3991 and toprim domain-containing protein [Oscillospiraceae bacterium]|nr:DUF3991 and toprim domain-containing protein [Oscillospiraceae bacterium]
MATVATNNVTKAQIEAARNIDILTYLQVYEPDNLRKVGNEYRLRDHDSITISNGKWYRHSQDIGGANALDFLVKVRGVHFVDAVQSLVGKNTPTMSPTLTTASRPPPPKPFKLPLPNADNQRVFDYLASERGIDVGVIGNCVRDGLIYENEYGACVFVGKDKDGQPRHASVRATKGNFKQDVAGSNKAYCFSIPRLSDRVIVYESPIDLLSHLTLENIHEQRDNAYHSAPHHRLSLGGVSIKALDRYLKDHPNIKHVDLRLDGDDPGKAAAIEIRKTLLNKGYSVDVYFPKGGKDYNHELVATRRALASTSNRCLDTKTPKR